MHRVYGNLRRIRDFPTGRCGHRPLRTACTQGSPLFKVEPWVHRRFRSTLNLATYPLRHFLRKYHLPLPRGARQEEAFASLKVFLQIRSCQRAEQSPAPTKAWVNSYCFADFERRAFLPQQFKGNYYQIGSTVTGGAYLSSCKVSLCVRNG